jgi:SRSO17 transposase
MGLETIADGADRFVAYVEELRSVIGHADRAVPLRDYCAGLLATEGRKSVEPMAAATAPSGFRHSTRSFCISLPAHRGRTNGYWPRYARW